MLLSNGLCRFHFRSPQAGWGAPPETGGASGKRPFADRLGAGDAHTNDLEIHECRGAGSDSLRLENRRKSGVKITIFKNWTPGDPAKRTEKKWLEIIGN